MNDLSIQMLNGLSSAFYGMTLKDLVVFSHVVDQKGVLLTDLKKLTAYTDNELQASIRKLTGSKLATQQTRYLLIKEVQGIKGMSYFLTTKGLEYAKLLNQPAPSRKKVRA